MAVSAEPDMIVQSESCLALLEEIANFYAGFGNTGELVQAVRNASLLIPIGEDSEIALWEYGGIRWIPAFTDQYKLAKFAVDLGFRISTPGGGPGDEPPPLGAVYGWRLFDQILPSTTRPTGVVVDINTETAMAFPPVEEISPRAYLDETDMKDGVPAWVTKR